jgi:poly(A) polymerase
MLLAPQAGAGISLLRETGLEAAIAAGVPDNAGRWVDAVPRDLWLRLAAWLPRKTASRFLRVHRFGEAAAKRVLRILDHHPIEQQADPKRLPSVRRIIRNLTGEQREALFTLREAELTLALDAEALRATTELAALREAIARIQAQDAQRQMRGALKLDGKRAMEIVGCGPGPVVGRALRYLEGRVDAGELSNERAALEQALRAWLTSPTQ